jgi:hypothetical protein
LLFLVEQAATNLVTLNRLIAECEAGKVFRVDDISALLALLEPADASTSKQFCLLVYTIALFRERKACLAIRDGGGIDAVFDQLRRCVLLPIIVRRL